MALKPPTWYEERNTEGFKSWLIANGIDLGIVPEDAEISVVDGVIHYERVFLLSDDKFALDEVSGRALRRTEMVKEIVPRGVA